MRVRLRTPSRFHFRRTVLSHGWYDLPPFAWDERAGVLETVAARRGAPPFLLRLRESGAGVEVSSPGGAAPEDRRERVRAAARILNLELDLEPFYRAAAGVPGLGWAARAGAGRLLQAPSLWEDVAKLILTTNCSWAMTRRMTVALVEGYGEAAPGGRKAFPLPGRLAAAGEEELKDAARLGYRARYLAAVARRFEAWGLNGGPLADLSLDADAFRREALALPGVGPYVVENLLRMQGRPDGPGLDSWIRSKYARLYHQGRKVSDRTIERRYRRAGRWAGLALWCDLTRDWLDDPEGWKQAAT